MPDPLPYAPAANALWPRRPSLEERPDGFVLTLPVRPRWNWYTTLATVASTFMGLAGVAAAVLRPGREIIASAAFFLGMAVLVTGIEVMRRGIPTVLDVGSEEITLVVPRPGLRHALTRKTWRIDQIRSLRLVRSPWGIPIAEVRVQPRRGMRVPLFLRTRDREFLARVERAIGRHPFGSRQSSYT